jgi:hypothetical protein
LRSQPTVVSTVESSLTGSMSWQFSGRNCGSWLNSGRLQAPSTAIRY